MDKSQILGSALFLFLVGQGCYFLLGKILFLIEKATYFWFFFYLEVFFKKISNKLR